MSGKVINSPEAVRSYAKQIKRYIDQQNQLLQGLKSAHSRVGGQSVYTR